MMSQFHQQGYLHRSLESGMFQEAFELQKRLSGYL